MSKFLKALEQAESEHALREQAGQERQPPAELTIPVPTALVQPIKTKKATGQPKLRSDLVVSRQETSAGTFFVVKEPRTGQFFRLKEVEHYITQQLDGSTPLDVIRQRVQEKFAAPLEPDTLKQFIKSLRQMGLLETGETDSGHLSERRGLVRGSLFYLRFKLFDPDRLFDRTAGRLRFFFTPSFLIFSAAFILFALGITVVNWNEIKLDLLRLYQLQALPIVLLTVLIIGAAHESAHGLTCKHFGGEVREMGLMLIYLLPAFYCNVSDAWLLPEKSKRLWVAFAGPYFELFLWALATLTWRLTDQETGLNYAALVVMTTSGIKTLFNFTPLIKLDGYYLLSDYLEMPNLRKKSFRYVGSGIKKLWGGSSSEEQAATAREKWIYLVYGLLAVTYTSWLLIFIGERYGSVLVDNYGGWGLALFGVLVFAKIQSRFRRLFSRRSTPAKPAKVKWKIAPLLRLVRNVTVLGVALVVVFLGRMQLKIPGEFRVLPIHNADVRAEVDGIIEAIHVDEGDRVHEGDLIAELVERDSRADLRKTEAEIDEKRAKLRMLKAGKTPEEINVARAAAGKAQEELKRVMYLLSINKAAFERQLVSQREYQEAQAKVAVQEKDVEEAQGKLKVLLAGSRREEIEATEAELSRLETQRSYLAEQIKLLRVPSPITGVVTTPSRQLKAMIGQHAKKGELIAKVHELKTITVEIAVPEKEIGDVRLGQPVALKARAYPQETFHGKVTSIATTVRGNSDKSGSDNGVTPVAAPGVNEGSAGRAVLVTTEIDNSSLLLKPEMTGKAKIYCGERQISDLMTRRLARYLRVEFWSWW